MGSPNSIGQPEAALRAAFGEEARTAWPSFSCEARHARSFSTQHLINILNAYNQNSPYQLLSSTDFQFPAAFRSTEETAEVHKVPVGRRYLKDWTTGKLDNKGTTSKILESSIEPSCQVFCLELVFEVHSDSMHVAFCPPLVWTYITAPKFTFKGKTNGLWQVSAENFTVFVSRYKLRKHEI